MGKNKLFFKNHGKKSSSRPFSAHSGGGQETTLLFEGGSPLTDGAMHGGHVLPDWSYGNTIKRFVRANIRNLGRREAEIPACLD